MSRDQMTKQEAIEEGWKPIVHNYPREFGGKTTMWQSPCGSFELFCPPTFRLHREWRMKQLGITEQDVAETMPP